MGKFSRVTLYPIYFALPSAVIMWRILYDQAPPLYDKIIGHKQNSPNVYR